METELKVPVSEQVNLTLNYTYNDGRDLSSGASKPLSSLPLHTANSSLDWKPVDDWSFYLSANYSGQRRATTSTSKTSGGYTLWDIGTAYQMTKAIKWRAGVQNLMDKDLNYDDYSFNEEGRRYFIAMDYTF